MITWVLIGELSPLSAPACTWKRKVIIRLQACASVRIIIAVCTLQYSLIAAHLNPDDAEEWARLADMCLDQNNVQQALTCYEKGQSRYAIRRGLKLMYLVKV